VWSFFELSGKISMRKKLTQVLANVRAILSQGAEREVQQLTGNWPNGSPSLQTKSLSILVDGCGGKKTLQRHEVRSGDRIARGRVFADMTSN
jgi:hypothetical protein